MTLKKTPVGRLALVTMTSITHNLTNLMYRPYAYDVTEGRPCVLGVKRGTATCAIAKHAASGPTPACHTAGLARAHALTERLRAPTRSASTTHVRSATSLDPQHGVVVMETWRQCIRSINSYMLASDWWNSSNILHQTISCNKALINKSK